MSSEFNDRDKQENLKAENEFLKMKLMLEQGAQFSDSTHNNLPPQVENYFLNNIIEFEKQWENVKYIKLFDKIQRPSHFKPAGEIPDERISEAWRELSAYLEKYSIQLDACSPNITERELYRFTIEELFQHDIEDMDIPGMNTCFIYDEFHPDPVYDNTRMVEQDLFGDIFRKEDLSFDIHYERKGFRFNGAEYTNLESFFQLIRNFKSIFDEISLQQCSTSSCAVNGNECSVKGNYFAIATTGNEDVDFKGNFEVELKKGDLGYWFFIEILIEGFDPH